MKCYNGPWQPHQLYLLIALKYRLAFIAIAIDLTFIELWLCFGHSCWCFVVIHLIFTISLKAGIVLSPSFYKCKNWGTESLSNLSKVIYWLCEDVLQTHSVYFQSYVPNHYAILPLLVLKASNTNATHSLHWNRNWDIHMFEYLFIVTQTMRCQ